MTSSVNLHVECAETIAGAARGVARGVPITASSAKWRPRESVARPSGSSIRPTMTFHGGAQLRCFAT